jgi:hypothetical protein
MEPTLRKAFETMTEASLPDAVGAVWHKGRRLLFLKADMGRAAEPKPERPQTPEPIAPPEAAEVNYRTADSPAS